MTSRFAVAALLAAVACARSDGQPPATDSTAAVATTPSAPAARDTVALARAVETAVALPALRSLLVQQRDTLLVERYVHGAAADRLANLKSASKSVLSAVVGIAIAEGRIAGTDQTLAALLPDATRGLDSAKRAITVGDLLSMRSGLESTSFDGYGRWVSSRNWVQAALARPLVAPPGHAGGPMIYSTGNSHLLSAAVTRATRSSTHAYAARVLARPLGIRLRPWATDPQGIAFGGNEMRMTPREMLRFGALFEHGGVAPPGTPDAGKQVIPAAWIDSSWTPRGRSGYSGEAYGYGWWIRSAVGRRATHPVYYAWGYGGQFVYVVPSLDLVVVATSDPAPSRRERGHLQAIHRALDEIVVAVGG